MRRALVAFRRNKAAFAGALLRRAQRGHLGGRLAGALLGPRLRAGEERVFAALGGALSFQILRTAHAVGLFALLDARPGLAAEPTARALGLSTYATEVLLLGLVSMRLVERSGDGYHVDPIVSELVSDRAGFGPIVDFFREVVNPASLHLEEAVRTGRPAALHRLFGAGATSFYEAIGRDARLGPTFREAMRADTGVNRERVASSPIFGGLRRILDVGGSSGELAIAIAAHHAGARVTVLDFPEVAAEARARFRDRGLEDRLDALGADLLEAPWPEGYDCILFAHLLDIFSRENVARLLAKAFDALPVGGELCVFGSVMNDAETGPRTYGVLSSYFLCLANGEGRFYTAAQIAAAMRGAGFASVGRTELPRGEVLMHATKEPLDAGNRLAAFVRLGRPKFLAYSLLLYGLGSAAYVHEGRAVEVATWLRGLAFVWLAHLMTHYCNERFDLTADALNPAPTRWTGGSRVLVERRLSPRVSLGAAIALLLAGLGLAITMPCAGLRGLALLTLALGWFYTAPPLALNYRGLGEVTVATGLNVAVPLLAYGLQRGALAFSAPLVGALCPGFVAQVARMLVMNLADHEGDRLAEKRTLAVALGPRRARIAIVIAQALAYGSIVALTATGVLPQRAAAPMLLTLPVAWWHARRVLATRVPGSSGSLAFWASTHVALLVAAASVGLLVAPASAGALACVHAPSRALCAAIVIAFGLHLAAQIRGEHREARS